MPYSPLSRRNGIQRWNQLPSIKIPHSSSIPEAGQSNLKSRNRTSECVICIKTFTLFEHERAHVSFEQSLRKTPCKDWSLIWNVDGPDPSGNFPRESGRDRVDVRLSVAHKGGYGWGIGKTSWISRKSRTDVRQGVSKYIPTGRRLPRTSEIILSSAHLIRTKVCPENSTFLRRSVQGLGNWWRHGQNIVNPPIQNAIKFSE